MPQQEIASAATIGTGVALTQAPMTLAQGAGLVIGFLGLVWNIYAVITRNRHNRFVREQAQKAAQAHKKPEPPPRNS